MVLMEIHSIFENRKNSILQLLGNQDPTLTPEKKSELQGAKNEIELFLKTLEYFYKENNSAKPQAGTQPVKKERATPHDLMSNPEEESSNLLFNVMDSIFGKRKN